MRTRTGPSASRTGVPRPAHLLGDEPATRERALAADVDGPGRAVDLGHPARDAVADAEAAALADGEAVHAGVGRERRPVLGAGSRRGGARLGVRGAPRTRRSRDRGRSRSPDFPASRRPADRADARWARTSVLVSSPSGKRVRASSAWVRLKRKYDLVLRLVAGAQQPRGRCRPARRDRARSGRSRPARRRASPARRQSSSNLRSRLQSTHGFGVRPRRYSAVKTSRDALAKRVPQVPDVVRNAEMVGDAARVAEVFERAAALPCPDGRGRRRRELHRHADDVEALVLQQRRRDRAVHAAAHRDYDPWAGHAASSERRAMRARTRASACRMTSTSAAVLAHPRLRRSDAARVGGGPSHREQHVRRLGGPGRARRAGRSGDAFEVERGDDVLADDAGRTTTSTTCGRRARRRRRAEARSGPRRARCRSRDASRSTVSARAPRARARRRASASAVAKPTIAATFSVPARSPLLLRSAAVERRERACRAGRRARRRRPAPPSFVLESVSEIDAERVDVERQEGRPPGRRRRGRAPPRPRDARRASARTSLQRRRSRRSRARPRADRDARAATSAGSRPAVGVDAAAR